MVVYREVLRDRADTVAAVTHRRDPRRDGLVERGLDRLGELSLNENLGNGAKPLRSRPPLVVRHVRIFGYTDLSLQRASSTFICQSTPRCVRLASVDHADTSPRRVSRSPMRRPRAHSRFPGHALTPTGVMAIRCKQFHLPDL